MLARFEAALAGGSLDALHEVAVELIERVEVADGVVRKCVLIAPLEKLYRQIKDGGDLFTNYEPGGDRTHDIHLKRVLLYH